MMVDAILRTESKDPESVAASLSLDNCDLDGLRVSSSVEDGMVVSSVEGRSVGTVLSTLDDLVCCQITSESLV